MSPIESHETPSLAPGVSREYLLHHQVCPKAIDASGALVVAIAPNSLREAIGELAAAYKRLAIIDEVSLAEVERLIERLTTESDRSIELAQATGTYAMGGYVGAGATFWFTNAAGVRQLAGPFRTVSVNVGYGLANLGIQLSFGGGIWQFSVTPPFASVGFGFAGSMVTTYTKTTPFGCR